MSKLEQWVNLPKNNDFVEDNISSIERLSEVIFEVEMTKAQVKKFKASLVVWGSKNENYSKNETTRYAKGFFNVKAGPLKISNGSKKGKYELNLKLPAAGGNEYKIKAKSGKKEVLSNKFISTRRKLYYQSMNMKGIKTPSLAGMESAFWSEKNRFYLQLKSKAVAAEIPRIKTIISGDNTSNIAFIKSCAAKFDAAVNKFFPYCFGVTFIEQSATPGDIEIQDELDLNIPGSWFNRKYSGDELILKSHVPLWYGLVPSDDAAKAWLIRATLEFKDHDGNVERININRADISIHGRDYHTHGGKYEVKIKLDADAIDRRRIFKRKGKFFARLKIKTAAGFQNGFAYNEINLLAICERARWENIDPATQLAVLNHEMGHKVGMVSNGIGTSPDKPSFHYTGQLHTGNHCSNGASYDASKVNEWERWAGTPKCVMYGSNAIGNHSIPSTFCPECSPALRKVDLSESVIKAGPFKYSMKRV